MLQFILRVVLIVPIFPLLACSTNSKDAGEPPKGWLRHTSPMGFSIDYPADWQVLADPQRGRFTVFKAGGLFQMDGSITIRPMFLPGRHLDEREAGTLLSQLGNNLHTEESIFGMNANARWSAPKYSRGFATITSDEPFKEVAILYWAGSPQGTAAILFYLVSSLDKYASVAPVYEKILQSFRILNDQPAGGKSAPGGRPSLGQIQYVRWTDPLENAFSMSVPQGWKALGGMYRKSALDTRPALTLLSPSGGVCIKMGSPEVGIFMEPLYTAMGNMTSGSLPQHDGTQLEIRPYQPGRNLRVITSRSTLGRNAVTFASVPIVTVPIWRLSFFRRRGRLPRTCRRASGSRPAKSRTVALPKASSSLDILPRAQCCCRRSHS